MIWYDMKPIDPVFLSYTDTNTSTNTCTNAIWYDTIRYIRVSSIIHPFFLLPSKKKRMIDVHTHHNTIQYDTSPDLFVLQCYTKFKSILLHIYTAWHTWLIDWLTRLDFIPIRDKDTIPYDPCERTYPLFILSFYDNSNDGVIDRNKRHSHGKMHSFYDDTTWTERRPDWMDRTGPDLTWPDLTSSVYSRIAFYLFCFEHTYIDKPNNQPEHIKKEKPCGLIIILIPSFCQKYQPRIIIYLIRGW